MVTMAVQRHTILVDFRNTGEMFRLVVEGIKEDILEYFYRFSNDVRYVKNRGILKKDKGIMTLPCGVVRNCTWECTKSDVMTKYSSQHHDKRKEVVG